MVYAQLDFRRGCLRMIDVLEMCFDIRKCCVTRLDVYYMHFKRWKGCVRLVDVWKHVLTSGRLCRYGRCVGNTF